MADTPRKYSPEKWDEEKAAQAEAWATMTPEDFTAETGKTPADHAALREAVLRYQELQGAGSPSPAPPPAEGSQASPAMQEAVAFQGDAPAQPEVSMTSSLGHGLARGATADFADEGAAALMGGSAGDTTGIPREYAAGSRYADNRNTLRQEQDDAAAANPKITGAGMIMGGAPTALALPGAGAGATVGQAAGRAALTGGALGAVTGAGASEAPTLRGVAQDTLHGAGTGAVTGAVVGGAAAGIGKLGPKVKNWLDAKADKNRVAGFGLYGSQMRDLADNIGEEGVSKLARDAEAAGLHKGQVLGLTGGVERGAKNAEALRRSSGETIRQTEDEILAHPNVAKGDYVDQPGAGVRVDQRPMINGLREDASKMNALKDPDAPADATFATKTADSYAEPRKIDAGDGTERTVEKDYIPLKDAIANKRDVQGRVNWSRKGGIDASPAKEVTRKYVAKELRGGIESSLKGAADQGQLSPELVQKYLKGNEDFHLAATLEDPAQARVYREAGNQKIGLLDMIAADAGFAHGGPHGLAAVAASKLLKNRGAPALANIQRASATGAGATGQALSNGAGAIGNLSAEQTARPGAGAIGNLSAEQTAQLQTWLAAQKNGTR